MYSLHVNVAVFVMGRGGPDERGVFEQTPNDESYEHLAKVTLFE